MEGRRRCLGLKTVLAILGVISGASICVTFGASRNFNASIWGFLTGVFAAIVLNLHLCYRKNILHLKFTPETLGLVKLCGILCSIIALSASIIYFVLMSVFKQGYKMEDDGYAPAGIFALLSLKWTVMMFFEGRWYERFLRSTHEYGDTSNEEYLTKHDSGLLNN
ncbi:hypothetical protein JTE90_018927 [Oedothorax gibbosus]|uniref:Heme transporter hrg1-A n=1 Tax=Oedothorax gibbosus TaxID=931172 RepID=A0AAV6VT97_9ARAC|nr:hypothetical protein JTE90_018927 [Oedothorax gibbosus]